MLRSDIRDPAVAYLARLAPIERRGMRRTLAAIAALLTNGHCTNALQYDWSSLNHQQTAAVWAALANKHYAPPVANRYLEALREVLKECRQLGFISFEDYQRAVDLEPFRRAPRAGTRAAVAQQPLPSTRPIPAIDSISRESQSAAASYLSRLMPRTRKAVRSGLDRIAGLLTNDRCTDALQFDWVALEHQHTEALRAALIHGPFARSTANQYMSNLRGVLSECERLGYVSAEAFQRALDLEPIPANLQRRSRALEQRSDDPRHTLVTRDAAILAARSGAPLSLSEVVALDFSDYDRAAGFLRVRGKRQKERRVVIADDCGAALDAWIEIRGVKPGPLFIQFWPPVAWSRHAA